MTKRLLGVIAALFIILGTITVPAFAAVSVQYLDENGETQSQDNCTELTTAYLTAKAGMW